MERARESVAETESVTDLEGAAAPPRKNGELVFGAPWQSRAFGMAVVLHGEGLYSWEEFSARLAAEIAAGESGTAGDVVMPVAAGAEAEYYERWLQALEGLLAEKGLLSGEDLEERTGEFAAGVWDHEH